MSWQSALTKTLDTSYDRAQSEGLEWALRDEHLAKFDQMTRGGEERRPLGQTASMWPRGGSPEAMVAGEDASAGEGRRNSVAQASDFAAARSGPGDPPTTGSCRTQCGLSVSLAG